MRIEILISAISIRNWIKAIITGYMSALCRQNALVTHNVKILSIVLPFFSKEFHSGRNVFLPGIVIRLLSYTKKNTESHAQTREEQNY